LSIVEPTAEAIEKAIRPNTNIIFTESPTNPYLRVLDLVAIVKIAKKHRVMTLIDATLATPYNIKPLEMGVDIVIHSQQNTSAAITTCWPEWSSVITKSSIPFTACRG